VSVLPVQAGSTVRFFVVGSMQTTIDESLEAVAGNTVATPTAATTIAHVVTSQRGRRTVNCTEPPDRGTRS
jgi:hypothetical protein